MISSATYSTAVYCANKESNAIPTALLATTLITEILAIAVAAFVLYKGIGVLPAALILGGGTLTAEGIVSGYLIYRENKPEIKPTRTFESLRQTTKRNHFIKSCDRFSDSFPTDESRIFLKNGTATNGAVIWCGDIQIQGPQTEDHIYQLWNLVAQKKVAAIVRIGKDNLETGCCIPYTPTLGNPIRYPTEELAICALDEEPTIIAPGITCKEYTFSSPGFAGGTSVDIPQRDPCLCF